MITKFFDCLNPNKLLFLAIFLSIISGIFYSLGFPSSFFPSSMLFSHLGVFLFFFIVAKTSDCLTVAKILILTLIFSMAHNFMGFYWIAYTLEIFGGLKFPWNNLLSTLFSFIVIPYYFLLAIIIFYRREITQKFSLRNNSFPLFLSSIAVILENYFPQQFPAHLGHTWMHLSPYLGLAPIGGAPLFSFVSYYLIFSLIDFCLTKNKKNILLPLLTFIVFLFLNISNPLDSAKWKNQNNRTLNVRMVQGNIGNFIKISAEGGLQTSISEVYKDFYELSLKNLPKKNDLIIWPETAYPKLLNSQNMKINESAIPETVRRVLINSKSSLLFGGYDFAKDDTSDLPEGFMTEYNSAFFVSYDEKMDRSELKNVYHKIKLIPFGEGLPFGPLNPFLGRIIENISFFAKGSDPQSFTTKKGFNFFTIICYETLFSSFIRNFVIQFPQTDFIVNITNDSWYGRTSEPFQHLFLAKWRPLEFQIPMLRMTNTGITSIIYPDGSESKRSQLFEKTFQDNTLSLPDRSEIGLTCFARFGHLVWPSLCLFLSLLNYFFRTKPSRNKS